MSTDQKKQSNQINSKEQKEQKKQNKQSVLMNRIKKFIFVFPSPGKNIGEANDASDVADECNVNKQSINGFSKSYEMQNPYVKGAEGRREWNDRYMNMSQSIRNWQMAFFAAAALALVLALTVARLASESKIKPYVVETNQGVPYAVRPVTGISPKDQLLINYAVNQFVINAKSVIADTAAEKSLLDRVYAYSSGNTINFLQDFYAKNNPFNLAGSSTISVSIVNALPVSANTWQVIWEETKRSVNGGSVIGVSRWVGHFTYQLADVNPEHINDNPFGIYITNVSWSQSQ